jgi:hypothetical protein
VALLVHSGTAAHQIVAEVSHADAATLGVGELLQVTSIGIGKVHLSHFASPSTATGAATWSHKPQVKKCRTCGAPKQALGTPCSFCREVIE